MNEKFGLISNFCGLNKKSPPKPPRRETTDKSPRRNRESLLTDDDSDPESPQHIKFANNPPNEVLNRILESSSSSRLMVERDPDETFCSEAEKQIKKAEVRRPSSKTLFNSEETEKLSNVNPKLAETVAGFSDEELSSRFSGMSMTEKRRIRISRRADTIAGAFSDVSEDDEEEPKNIQIPPQKKIVKSLADTVVQSSTDEDEDDRIEPFEQAHKAPYNKPKRAKQSLPATIIGFSESMTQSSIYKHSEPIAEEEEDQSVESEFDDDVITVLDSEEELEASVFEEHQPPVLSSSSSYQNVSSIDGLSKIGTNSNSTLNKFFNNPPIIDNPERVISHSVIQRQKDFPVTPVQKDKLSTLTPDRFIMHNLDSEEEEEDDGDGLVDVVLPETDASLEESEASEVQQSMQNLKLPDVEENDSEEEEGARPVESNDMIRSEPSKLTNVSTPDRTISSQSSRPQTVINVSAKISINLKISMRNSSGSSESNRSDHDSSASSSSDESQPPSRTQTPLRPKNDSNKVTPKTNPPNRRNDSTRKEKQTSAPNSGKKENHLNTEQLKMPAPSVFVTPSKSEIVIDEATQKELNALYGNGWKTPDMLKLCKSRSVQDELRKSIHTNNFENFVRNLPMDLESTRINKKLGQKASSTPAKQRRNQTPESKSSKKPSQKSSSKRAPVVVSDSDSEDEIPLGTLKRTTLKPLVKQPDDESFLTPAKSFKPLAKPTGSKQKILPSRSAAKTPKYLEICDSDTPSDYSPSDDETLNDSDNDANDTWNASSDEEYDDEAARIKKRSIARKSRFDEMIVFVPEDSVDDRQSKVDKFLETFEFKKPPGMVGVDTPKPKKKLFTHSHYDDDNDFVEPIDERRDDKENEQSFMPLQRNLFLSPFPISKEVEVIKDLEAPKTPAKKTPKAKTPAPKLTPRPAINKFSTFSFLKSLDAEADPILCDSNALEFRKKFKSKKLELCDILFKLYNEKVFDNQLNDVPIRWNKKLLNTAGRCNNCRRMGARQSQLELSDKVLTSADRLRCTLIHEMCHAATWILHGENGHGTTWKKWASKANAAFPELPKINVCHDYVIEYKYTYQCIKCKAKSQAHSKSKKVENIRCSICHGSIELFINKKGKDGSVVMTPVSKEVKGFPKFVQMKYKEVKTPSMSHTDVMKTLAAKFALLSTQEKQNL